MTCDYARLQAKPKNQPNSELEPKFFTLVWFLNYIDRVVLRPRLCRTIPRLRGIGAAAELAPLLFNIDGEIVVAACRPE